MRVRYLLTMLLLVACVAACAKTSQPGSPAATTLKPGSGEAMDMHPTVTLRDGFVVRVEVAADSENRAQGLMYRDGLRAGTGMLFLFAENGEYPFWMKNTRIPLDMIWIDSAKRVVHVKHQVPPCKADPCPRYPPDVESRYVLELAGGVAREHGIAVGDVLRFDGLDGVVVR